MELISNKKQSELTNIDIIGIATIRYNCVVLIDSRTVIYPLGVYIIKYDLIENKITTKKELFNSLILTINKQKDMLIVTSQNSKCCILNLDLETKAEFECEEGIIAKYSCLNSDYTVCCVYNCHYQMVKNNSVVFVFGLNILDTVNPVKSNFVLQK